MQLLIIARDNDSTPADVKEAVEKSIVSDIIIRYLNRCVLGWVSMI